MDPKKELQKWPDLKLNSDQNYCLYQQRYPTRLPKLVEQTDSKKNRRPSATTKLVKRQTTIPAEQKQMYNLETINDLFSRRELKKSDREKILKETESLQLEEYLDEESIVEPFPLPIYQSKQLKNNKEKKKNSPSTKRSSTRRVSNETVGDVYQYQKPHLQRRGSASNNRTFSENVLSASPIKRVTAQPRSKSISEDQRPNSGRRGSGSPKSVKTDQFKPSNQSREIRKQFIKSLKNQKESVTISSLKSNEKVRRRSISPSSGEVSSVKDIHEIGASETVKPPSSQHYLTESQPGQPSHQPIQPEAVDEELIDLETKVKKLELDNEELSKTVWFDDKLEEDKLMRQLRNTGMKFLPQRDEDDKLHGRPITYCVAKNLRLLLFGSTENSFNFLWRQQSLVFDRPNHYGLRFFKDGPIELMASLQAFVMKHLLFLNTEPVISNLAERLLPNEKTQERVLSLAVSDVLWKCGENKCAVVTLPLGECPFIVDSSYKEDRITEKMEIFKFTNSDDLEKFIRWNINLVTGNIPVSRNNSIIHSPHLSLSLFQKNGGCISFLYSMMLSRGLNRLLEDFRELQHGILQSNQDSLLYRSQALINLGIYGQAVPNIFNGESEYFNIMENRTVIHKGIQKRSEIGFLTLEEFTDPKNFQVGSRLKTPLYPIWVAKINSKLCVLFCLKKDLLNDWKLERRFDIHHYQGVPKHVGFVSLDVKLTIDTILPYNVDLDDEEETSTLEQTIRTKWEDAVIEWNGHNRF